MNTHSSGRRIKREYVDEEFKPILLMAIWIWWKQSCDVLLNVDATRFLSQYVTARPIG